MRSNVDTSVRGGDACCQEGACDGGTEESAQMLVRMIRLGIGDGVITHGQRGTNRPPPGSGGYELWVKGPNLGIMAKVSYGSWT